MFLFAQKFPFGATPLGVEFALTLDRMVGVLEVLSHFEDGFEPAFIGFGPGSPPIWGPTLLRTIPR